MLNVARLLEQYGEAYAVYVGVVGEHYATAEGFDESYCGAHESFAEYAEELFDELYGHLLSEPIRFYIDYDKFARDLIYNGEYSYDRGEDGTVYIFRNY